MWMKIIENIKVLIWKMMEKCEEVVYVVILEEEYVVKMSLFLRVRKRKIKRKNIVSLVKSVLRRKDGIGVFYF